MEKLMIIGLFIVHFTVSGQNQNIQEIETQAKIANDARKFALADSLYRIAARKALELQDSVAAMENYYYANIAVANQRYGQIDKELINEAIQIGKSSGEKSYTSKLILMLAGSYYQKREIKESLPYYEEGVALLKKTDPDYSKNLIRVASIYSFEYNDRIKFDSIAEIALQSSFMSKDSAAIAISHGGYSASLFTQQRYFEAMQSLLTAIDFLPNDPRRLLLRINYINDLGELFQVMGQPDKAIEHYQRALDLAEKKQYKTSIAEISGRIGQLHVERKEYSEALKLYKKANTIYQKTRRKAEKVYIPATITRLYLYLDQPDSAAYYFNSVPKQLVMASPQFAQAHYYRAEGEHLLYKKQFKEAIQVFKKLANYTNSTSNSLFTLHALKGLENGYFGLGNYKESLQYKNRFHVLNDSIFRSNQSQKILDLEAKYRFDKKENEIALLNQENEIQEARLSFQQRALWIGGLGLLVLSTLVFSLYKLYQKLRITNNLLEKNVNEKNLLLKEIHHRVKNNLQIISSLLSLQSRYINDPNALDAINEGRNRVSSMAILHQNIYQDDMLTSIKVKKYFQDLIEGLSDSYRLHDSRIDIKHNIENINLDIDSVIPLGLMVTELVTNSIKHAYPDNDKGTIEIGLKEKDHTLVLQVKDDGVGFDKSLFFQSQSFGNKMLRAFADRMKADISIENNDGTSFTITITQYKKAA